MSGDYDPGAARASEFWELQRLVAKLSVEVKELAEIVLAMNAKLAVTEASNQDTSHK